MVGGGGRRRAHFEGLGGCLGGAQRVFGDLEGTPSCIRAPPFVVCVGLYSHILCAILDPPFLGCGRALPFLSDSSRRPLGVLVTDCAIASPRREMARQGPTPGNVTADNMGSRMEDSWTLYSFWCGSPPRLDVPGLQYWQVSSPGLPENCMLEVWTRSIVPPPP